MANPYWNDPAYGWNTPDNTAASLPGAFPDPTQTGGILSGRSAGGPLSGAGGGFLSGLRGLLDPQYALPMAAQLIGGATPQASFAGALGLAGPAIGDMRKRAAMNAYLKAHSGLNLTPEEQQLLQSDPELGRAFVARQLTPKAPITVSPGDRLLDPNTYKPIDIGDAGGGYAGTGMEAQNWNIILRGKTDTPEYAAAYNQLFQTPKMASGTGPNNEITQTPYYPEIPPGVKPPTGMAPAVPATAAGGAAPAAAGGGPRTGTPIVTGQKAPTEQSTRAAGLLVKSAPDYKTAIKHFDALDSLWNQGLGSAGAVGRFFQGSEYKQAYNAAKAVVGNYQYTASGSAAPEDEVIRNLDSVLPNSSDDAATIADKKERMTGMMKAMQIVAQGGRIPQSLVKQIGIDVEGPGIEPPAAGEVSAASAAAGAGRPRAVNSQGEAVEWDGTAWVPAK